MTYVRAALEALSQPTTSADDRMIRQLCICERDDCFCLATAEIPATIAAESFYACEPCQAGRHVDVDGRRA